MHCWEVFLLKNNALGILLVLAAIILLIGGNAGIILVCGSHCTALAQSVEIQRVHVWNCVCGHADRSSCVLRLADTAFLVAEPDSILCIGSRSLSDMPVSCIKAK